MTTIGYTCDRGGDHFLQPVLNHLGQRFDIKHVQGELDLAEVDLLWVEWAETIAKSVTSKPLPVPIIVRLHSYEVFQPALTEIRWDRVDQVIFVAEHVRQRVGIEGPVIPCGIDLEQFTPPPNKKYGKRIGWVGGMNVKKGPMLLVQVIRAVTEWDPEFSFHLTAGKGDPRLEAYFEHATRDLTNVYRQEHRDHEHIHGWYQNMDYILSTSPWEGTAQSIGEGIACGCVPLVHDWPGGRMQYQGDSSWRTIRDILRTIRKYRIESALEGFLRSVAGIYRDFLPSQADSLAAIDKVVDEVLG